MNRLLDIFAETTYSEVVQKLPKNTIDPVKIVNVFLYIGGIAAVVMIIVSGVQMTTSAGNPGAVAKAKNTMIWSIVGLLVMILAYAIVNFVIGKIVS
jgi:multisubunit Na+/H+ antiporter MnhB subunit